MTSSVTAGRREERPRLDNPGVGENRRAEIQRTREQDGPEPDTTA